jgi:DNA processing protein
VESPVDDADIAAWLRLTEADGVGPESCRRLLSEFGPPHLIFNASVAQLGKLVSERAVRALKSPPGEALETLIAATAAWARLPGNRVVTLADRSYPQRLLEISDPPAILYVKGRAELLDVRSIAIVGSRNATPQGAANAERFAEALSQAGWAVVSGLALGIDAAAHEGALKGPGSTIAVVGTGADIVYPVRNRGLAHRIAEAAVIVSEFPLGTPAIAHNFPRRNRIISGLARGVLVVEAAAQSGSLITARLAAEQGREVFAIPGSIHSPFSKGCHRLIKDGAKLVESAQDVLEELGAAFGVAANSPPGSEPESDVAPATAESALLAAMGFDPVSPDELAARTGIEPAGLASELLDLELAGQISRLPGGGYQRLSK